MEKDRQLETQGDRVGRRRERERVRGEMGGGERQQGGKRQAEGVSERRRAERKRERGDKLRVS